MGEIFLLGVVFGAAFMHFMHRPGRTRSFPQPMDTAWLSKALRRKE